MPPTGLSQYNWSDPVEAELHPPNVIGRRDTDGLPVLGLPGRSYDMRGDQVDELPVTAKFVARMFKMWEPADLTAYGQIMEHTINGQMVVSDRVKIFANEDETGLKGQHLKIWLEWGQVYLQADTTGGRGGLR